MKTYIRYSDIPVDERKRLSAIAFWRAPVCSTFFMAVWIPTFLSNSFAKYLEPVGASLLMRSGVRFAVTFLGTGLILAVITRPLFKAEIEKLKNA